MFRKYIVNIKNSIEINQSEKKLFRLLFLYSFLIGLASSFFLVEASKSFILKVSIAEIPLAYIISGFTGYLLIMLYKKLQRNYGMNRSFELILLLIGIVMFLLFVGTMLFEKNILISKVMAFFGFILIFAFSNLFSLGFSGICLSIFNLSQSKRLLALLGTGEILASVLGFLIIPSIVKLIGSSNYLLIFSSALTLLSIIPIRKVVILTRGSVKASVKPSSIAIPSFNLNFILKNPFILYLSITTMFSIVTVYFIDYSYLISVRYFSKLTGIEIATVVSILFSIIKTGELFFSFFSSNIISAGGMKRSVSLLPFLLISGALMGVFSLIFFTGNPIFVIFFLFINKWTDRAIRKGVTVPATKIMFQINSPAERVQLQNNIDGVITQLSTIICGLLLVVVSYFTDTSNYDSFLKIITVICLLLFTVFFWFSKKLYLMYKNRIHEFLQSSQLSTSTIENKIHIEKIGADNAFAFNKDGFLDQKFNFLLKETDLLDQKKIRELICYYNPSASAYLNFTDDDPENEAESNRKITKLYFENQNVFSRLLIMSSFLCLDFDKKLKFFKDINKLTPLRLRSYYLSRLCAENRAVDNSQVFYFIELVTECINEILWTEVAIDDLTSLADNELLNHLELHKDEQLQVLLYLLELLHDKKSINLVRDILNSKERNEDDLLFAVELLENTLLPELKSMILPIFEPISFASRRKKLNKLFFINHLNIAERLSDILMRDFNMLDTYTKQLALRALIEIDQHSKIVKAFCSSKISNLQLIARSLDKDDLSNMANIQKDSISTQFCNSFFLDENDKINISRWAFKDSVGNLSSNLNEGLKKLFENNSTRIAVDSSANIFLEVDLLAPVLLYKCRTM